jgi:hypothetical protein
MSSREPGGAPEPILLIAAVAYLINAAITVYSKGWRDESWVAWLLMGAAFVLIAPLPREVRQSFRLTLKDRRGLIGTALTIIAIAMLLFRLVAR